MNRLFYLLGIAGLIVLPCRFVFVVIDDLNHPDRWTDWQRNPHVYGWMAVGVAILGLVLLLHARWGGRGKR